MRSVSVHPRTAPGYALAYILVRTYTITTIKAVALHTITRITITTREQSAESACEASSKLHGQKSPTNSASSLERCVHFAQLSSVGTTITWLGVGLGLGLELGVGVGVGVGTTITVIAAAESAPSGSGGHASSCSSAGTYLLGSNSGSGNPNPIPNPNPNLDPDQVRG